MGLRACKVWGLELPRVSCQGFRVWALPGMLSGALSGPNGPKNKVFWVWDSLGLGFSRHGVVLGFSV